jgi:predicted metalloprotease with PDZ domain
VSTVRRRSLVGAALLLCVQTAAPHAQSPVAYHLSFPERQHHLVHVEVTFAGIPPGVLEVVMSRTSPGRYAVHEFAKNVYDVRIDNGSGASLQIAQPSPSQWNVTGHAGTVRVRYKVFGDRLDGTFVSIDGTHAHMNMPAVLMWARGLETRPARVTFDAPTDWKVATQLQETRDPRTFSAANLQYLMDSQTELSAFTARTFTVDRRFRIALHHDGNDRDADRFSDALEKIVREARAVFGEFPAFEADYTFIADFLPWAAYDAMEHRNSTVLTFPGRLGVPDEYSEILSIAAHEIFHSWNGERIRPRSLEPFKFDQPNPSGELWVVEGFNHYYQPLLMRRAGFYSDEDFAERIGPMVDHVIRTPARKYRTVEDVSRAAQYMDMAVWSDPTSFANHQLTYYEWGAAIALGLDLSLRARTGGTVTLDHYMRRLWQEFGRVESDAPGTVPRPYADADLRDALAEVSGDRAFAMEFFDRYVHGRDVVDVGPLLARAGLTLKRRHPGRAWMGRLEVDLSQSVARVTQPTVEDTPVHAAGLDRGDEIVAVEGVSITSAAQIEEIVSRRRPGDTIRLSIRHRGIAADVVVTLAEDPTQHIVPAESTGRSLSTAEREFRASWLGSRQ